MQRITISVPKALYDDLVQHVPPGRVSQFAAQAIERRLFEADQDPIEEFIKVRKLLPKYKITTIFKAVKRGRE